MYYISDYDEKTGRYCVTDTCDAFSKDYCSEAVIRQVVSSGYRVVGVGKDKITVLSLNQAILRRVEDLKRKIGNRVEVDLQDNSVLIDCSGMTSIHLFSIPLKYKLINTWYLTIYIDDKAWNTLSSDDFEIFQGADENSEIIVIIGQDVKKIGRSALACQDLIREVRMLNGVSLIGTEAFYGCFRMLRINIPDTVNKIEEDAFGYCESLSEVIIPNSIKSLPRGVFKYCADLSVVTMPDVSIQEDTFLDCDRLEEFRITTKGKQVLEDDIIDYISEDIEITYI